MQGVHLLKWIFCTKHRPGLFCPAWKINKYHQYIVFTQDEISSVRFHILSRFKSNWPKKPSARFGMFVQALFIILIGIDNVRIYFWQAACQFSVNRNFEMRVLATSEGLHYYQDQMMLVHYIYQQRCVDNVISFTIRITLLLQRQKTICNKRKVFSVNVENQKTIFLSAFSSTKQRSSNRTETLKHTLDPVFSSYSKWLYQPTIGPVRGSVRMSILRQDGHVLNVSNSSMEYIFGIGN